MSKKSNNPNKQKLTNPEQIINTSGSISEIKPVDNFSIIPGLKALGGDALYLLILSALNSATPKIPEVFFDPELKESLKSMNIGQAFWSELYSLETIHAKVRKKTFDEISLKLVKFILTECESNIPISKTGDTLLHFAARHNNAELLDYLQENKSLNVTAKNSEGKMAIQYAYDPKKLSNKQTKLDEVLTETGKVLKNLMPANSINATDLKAFFAKHNDASIRLAKGEKDIRDMVSEYFLPYLMDSNSIKMDLFSFKDWYKTINNSGMTNIKKIIDTAKLPVLIMGIKQHSKIEFAIKSHIQNYGMHDGSLVLSDLLNIYKRYNQTDQNGVLEKIVETYITEWEENPEWESNQNSEKEQSYAGIYFIQSLIAHSKQYYEDEMYCAVKFLKLHEKYRQDNVNGKVNSTRNDIIFILINNSKITGNLEYLEYLARLLENSVGEDGVDILNLSNILFMHYDLLNGSKSIDELFGDYHVFIEQNRNHPNVLLSCFNDLLARVNKDEELKDKTHTVEANLLLDLLVKYAVHNNLIPQASVLIATLMNKGFQVHMTTSFAMLKDCGLITQGFFEKRELVSLELDHRQDVNLHLYKIIASICNNDINDHTFRSVENVYNFLQKPGNKSAHLMNVFASGCKLLAEHLLDNDSTDLDLIEKYLYFTRLYGGTISSEEQFKFLIRKQEIQEASKPDKTEIVKETVGANFDNLNKLAEICSNLPKIDETNISESDAKEERRLDRESEAANLLRNIINPSQKTVNQALDSENLEFHVGEKIYKSSDKITYTYCGNQREKNSIYQIDNQYGLIYAVIDEDLLNTLEESIITKALSALESGLSTKGNCIIKTHSYYKIRINEDIRIYTTDQHKSMLNGKMVTLVVFDKATDHKGINKIKLPLSTNYLKGDVFKVVNYSDYTGSDSGADTNSDIEDVGAAVEAIGAIS